MKLTKSQAHIRTQVTIVKPDKVDAELLMIGNTYVLRFTGSGPRNQYVRFDIKGDIKCIAKAVSRVGIKIFHMKRRLGDITFGKFRHHKKDKTVEFDCVYCSERTKLMGDGTWACQNPQCHAYDPSTAEEGAL